MRNVMLGVNPDPLIFASFPRLCSFVPKFDCAVVLFAGKVEEDYLVVEGQVRVARVLEDDFVREFPIVCLRAAGAKGNHCRKLDERHIGSCSTESAR